MTDSEAKETKGDVQPEVAEVVFPEHGSELMNEHGVEVVVHDLDEEGNVIGWHKELKQELKKEKK